MLRSITPKQDRAAGREGHAGFKSCCPDLNNKRLVASNRCAAFCFIPTICGWSVAQLARFKRTARNVHSNTMIRSNSLRSKSLLSSNPVARLAGLIDPRNGG